MAHILVVDDDPDVRGLVAFRLRKAGHEVLAAGDGEDALGLVHEHGAPDLAVLDVMMPGISGLQLLVELRKLGDLERLPAIFLSARILPADIDAGRDLGATYLTKPFVAPALMAAVTASLRPAEGEQAPAPPPVRRPEPAQRSTPPALPRELTSRPPPGFDV